MSPEFPRTGRDGPSADADAGGDLRAESAGRAMHEGSMPPIGQIQAALSTSGLILRGGFNLDPDDATTAVPALYGPAKSVLLIGNAGAAYWTHFEAWREAQPADLANPLDSWCREVVGAVAERFGARAVSPSDRPFLPFQQWAMRAEGLRPTPLGILMHPEYGLWHAYRGALLFDVELDIRAPERVSHLCDACATKPCLKACPIDAYSFAGFDYQGCLAHVRGAEGVACRSSGCLDRNACPHGIAYRYPSAVQSFHMASYIRPTG